MNFQIGYDLLALHKYGIKVALYAPLGHTICVGGTGSGKSTALLYWLYKMTRSKFPLDLYIADFKASHEFCGITGRYAEFEGCYDLIKLFYQNFLTLEEDGDGTYKILLIDEIAGYLMHLSLDKEGKVKADTIRQMMSSILMLGRSRKCFLWLAMQRFSASIFPSASGGGDNFLVSVGMSELTVDGRKSLFAGEHLEDEEGILFGQGKGIVSINGQPLQAVVVPRVSKRKLLEKLQKAYFYHVLDSPEDGKDMINNDI